MDASSNFEFLDHYLGNIQDMPIVRVSDQLPNTLPLFPANTHWREVWYPPLQNHDVPLTPAQTRQLEKWFRRIRHPGIEVVNVWAGWIQADPLQVQLWISDQLQSPSYPAIVAGNELEQYSCPWRGSMDWDQGVGNAQMSMMRPYHESQNVKGLMYAPERQTEEEKWEFQFPASPEIETTDSSSTRDSEAGLKIEAPSTTLSMWDGNHINSTLQWRGEPDREGDGSEEESERTPQATSGCAGPGHVYFNQT